MGRAMNERRERAQLLTHQRVTRGGDDEARGVGEDDGLEPAAIERVLELIAQRGRAVGAAAASSFVENPSHFRGNS